MNVLHTFLITLCLVSIRGSAGYEVINNEIIERIDLDNGQDLQLLSTSGKTSHKINQNVEKVKMSDEEGNSVQGSHENLGTGGRQPSIIYAAIQSMPQIISHRNGQVDTDEKTSPAPLEATEKPRDLRKPHSKLEEPSEDKSKDTKAKLYSHFKQTLPKLQPVHNVEILNKHDTFAIDTELTASTSEIATMRNVIVHPYATIIDEEKDLKAEQSEEPYIVYDKQDYLKLKNVKKTVKTHKIGDEKKSVYPKEEIRSVPTGYKEKDDLETDNTIWIGYGYGVQPYRYRYNDPSYPYGRPYSGWTRGYTGYPYYDNYRTRFLQSGYTGLSYDSNNNYGTGFGPYGVY